MEPSPTPPRREPSRSSAWLEFRQAVVITLPATAAAIPFAVLLGALATEKGFSVIEAGLMAALVFAGSAQFTVLSTWHFPPDLMLIGLATLVVNFRHVFMSTSILRHMGAFPFALKPIALFFCADEMWAFAEARAARRQLTPAFYAGLVGLFYLLWVAATVFGAFAGRLIRDPRIYGFDFAFVAIFIGLIMGFRGRRGFVVTVAASAGAATLVHILYPGPLSIVVGAMSGMIGAAAAANPEVDPLAGKA